jgi:hypothetical protein
MAAPWPSLANDTCFTPYACKKSPLLRVWRSSNVTSDALRDGFRLRDHSANFLDSGAVSLVVLIAVRGLSAFFLFLEGAPARPALTDPEVFLAYKKRWSQRDDPIG